MGIFLKVIVGLLMCDGIPLREDEEEVNQINSLKSNVELRNLRHRS